jgi:L-alanine-DL-glutamate epimerase-like enolase superfamily enzyme
MKITDVKTYPVFHGNRNYTFVKVETDEGIYGLGEFGITWKEQAGLGAIEHMKRHIIGLDPLNIEWIWQLLFRGDFFPGGRINTAAISAIDIALWDIKGKALNQPVHMLLGGKMRDKVVCYKSIGGQTPEDSARSARERVEEGWQYLRLSVNDRDGILEPRTAVRDSIAHFAAVREAVGPEIEIVIDVHTRLDTPDAIKLGRDLEPYDPFFIEDPLRCENPQTYHQLRRHVATPLAVGGLTEARKIANWCETHYIKIVPHNPLGPVSAAACLHLDLACDNFAVQEAGLVGNPVMEDLFPVQVPYENGYLLPSDKPGLGLEFDEDVAKASYGFEWQNGPQLRRKDGSFTNW